MRTPEQSVPAAGRATRSGRRQAMSELRAVTAHYDRGSGELTVALKNGVRLTFPAKLIRMLQHASVEELASIQVSSDGALNWPPISLHLNITGLVLEIMGAEIWRKHVRSAFAREAGAMSTPAKAQAARENGKRGGRPRRSAYRR